MKKKIGLIGGVSAASTIEYYRMITDLYFQRYKNYYYPEILIYSLDFQYFTDLENEKKTEEYIDYIAKAVDALARAGADFFAMTANSPHSVFDKVEERTGADMLSIVQTAASSALESGLKKVLLTGIKYTMQGSFYQEGFNKAGIEVIVPNESHQDEINDLIFSELCINVFRDETRRRFLDIISCYDVDGLILGCTELPLLISQKDVGIKVLDTLALHCRAILDYALVG